MVWGPIIHASTNAAPIGCWLSRNDSSAVLGRLLVLRACTYHGVSARTRAATWQPWHARARACAHARPHAPHVRAGGWAGARAGVTARAPVYVCVSVCLPARTPAYVLLASRIAARCTAEHRSHTHTTTTTQMPAVPHCASCVWRHAAASGWPRRHTCVHTICACMCVCACGVRVHVCVHGVRVCVRARRVCVS